METSTEIKAALEEIKKNFSADLRSNVGGYFSDSDWDLIVLQAEQKINTELKAYPQMTTQELRHFWYQQVADFHRGNHWGFRTQQEKPSRILTQEQKDKREMRSYMWTLFQAVVVMKLLILYFGLKSSLDPGGNYQVWLVSAIAVSYCSLIFFAWRKHKKT